MSADAAQREMEAGEAQLRGFARSIAEVEWLLLILVMLYLFVTEPELARDMMVLGALIAFAGFVLLFRYGRLLLNRARLKLTVETLAMVAFVTGVLSFSGGERSPLVSLYLLPIIAAALVLGRRTTALVVLLVCLCYALLATIAGGNGALTTELLIRASGALAPFVLAAYMTTLLAENLHTAQTRIRAMSERDELTQLYNMRSFTRLVEREHDVAAGSDRHYSVLMVDIDQLKAVNDAYGHEAGSRAITLVAEALQRLVRATDLVARYGGDEFIVFLADADKRTAEGVAQRVRNVVFSTTLEAGVEMVRVKVSVGVGSFPGDGNALQLVMAAAERAMYKNKEFREPPEGTIIFQKR